MRQPQTIRYLQRNQIDAKAWDHCIDTAGNGLIYAYSFYLDQIADDWDALVLNDYEAVMPLPWRKKFGLHYLYQPLLAAQLGLFGSDLDAGLLEDFLGAIPPKFKLWEFSLNHQNLFSLQGFDLYERVNYVLPLNNSYEQLYRNYRDNVKRNIKKSAEYGCRTATGIDPQGIVELSRTHNPQATEQEFRNFVTLYRHLHGQSKAKAYGVFSANNELVASAVFTFSHNRAYYILVGNHPNGRTLGASHALVDAFIKDHAQQQLLLDFEGSDIRSLSFFYSSFGAVVEPYAAIRLNKLPPLVKWAKTKMQTFRRR